MSKIDNLLPQITALFKNNSQPTNEPAAGNRQNFTNPESIENLSKTIQSYRNAKPAAVKSAKGDEIITVVMNGQTPEAHADAILKHFGFSKTDEAAFRQKFGYDLRNYLTDSYGRHDAPLTHKSLGSNLYRVSIPLPKSLLAQIEAVKPPQKSFDVPLPPTTVAAPLPKPLPTPISATQNVNKDVSQMTITEKLEIVINKAVEHLGAEAGAKLKQLITPENIAIMAGTTAALIAVQGVPVLDVVVDAAVLGLAAYSLGSEALSAISDLADFASKTFNTKTEADLDEAGKSLAKATATVGVDALAALLIHKGVKSIKAGEIPPPQTRVVEMVTPEGLRVKVRVPVEEVPDNVLLSKAKTQETDSLGRRNLDSHEGVSGITEGKQVGHAILKHVGKSESWLQNRIIKEGVKEASSFHNETVGNRTVGAFKKRFDAEINEWLKSGDKDPFKATIDMEEGIGLVVKTNKKGTPLKAEEATKAEIVLVKDNSEHGWHLLTVMLHK